MEVDDEVRGNVRRRICLVMNKSRVDFPSTPGYDDFLDEREDVIRKFLELHATQTLPEAAAMREELNRELANYEAANAEQILASKSLEDERKRERIKEVVRQEGLFFERINAEYSNRDKVLSHPLEAQYSLLPPAVELGGLKTVSKDPSAKRKTRLIPSNGEQVLPVAESIAATLEASGTVGLWKVKAIDALNRSLRILEI